MEKQNKESLTSHQRTLLRKLRAGDKLIISLEDGQRKYLLNGQEPLNNRTVECLRQKGFLIEACDAMFGVSQSLALAQPA